MTACENGRLRPLALQIGSLVSLFYALQWWVFRLSRLPESSYDAPFLVVEVIRNSPGWTLAGAVLLLVFAIRFEVVRRPWSDLTDGDMVRPLVTFLALILAWTYATYAFNCYFNRGHYFDRILLLTLAALIYWRPLFVLPFAVLVATILWQFNYPIGGFPATEQLVIVRILLLFCATLALAPWFGRQTVLHFVFVATCLLASSYWWPGVGKLRLNWITFGHTYHLTYSMYANGWLGFLDSSSIDSLADFLAKLDWPIRIGTLMIEIGALLFLWRRSVSLLLLAAWITFHFAVFIVAGFFLWKWILVDAAFWCVHYRRVLPIYTRAHFVLSVFLIGGSYFWFQPGNLAWYDSPVGYCYRYEAVTSDGNRYPLGTLSFEPYDYQFTLGDFSHLLTERRVYVVFGAIFDRPTADALLDADSVDEILDVEDSRGAIYYDANKAAKFESFIRRFVSNQNEFRGARSWFSFLKAPPQLWTFPWPSTADRQQPIYKIIVYHVTTAAIDMRYAEIRRQVVAEIEIPGPASLNAGGDD